MGKTLKYPPRNHKDMARFCWIEDERDNHCGKKATWRVHDPNAKVNPAILRFGTRSVSTCDEHAEYLKTIGCELQPIAEYFAELPAQKMEEGLKRCLPRPRR